MRREERSSYCVIEIFQLQLVNSRLRSLLNECGLPCITEDIYESERNIFPLLLTRRAVRVS
jgi:hypothetical protein